MVRAFHVNFVDSHGAFMVVYPVYPLPWCFHGAFVNPPYVVFPCCSHGASMGYMLQWSSHAAVLWCFRGGVCASMVFSMKLHGRLLFGGGCVHSSGAHNMGLSRWWCCLRLQ